MLLNIHITQDKTSKNRIWYKIRKQREEKGKGNKIMCKKKAPLVFIKGKLCGFGKD